MAEALRHAYLPLLLLQQACTQRLDLWQRDMRTPQGSLPRGMLACESRCLGQARPSRHDSVGASFGTVVPRAVWHRRRACAQHGQLFVVTHDHHARDRGCVVCQYPHAHTAYISSPTKQCECQTLHIHTPTGNRKQRSLCAPTARSRCGQTTSEKADVSPAWHIPTQHQRLQGMCDIVG
jgi:hypothetical protein